MVPSIRVVAALLLGSGFSALVYQTTWQRMFRLTFGASTAASAAVLAIFLGGLGLGGVLLGKRVERSARPLVFYGNLELGITLLAGLSPFMAAGVHAIYLALGGTQSLGTAGATLLRLLLTALVIGPTAVLMGGTLPAAARAIVSEQDAGRRSLALLYSLNTVGAVVGALVGPLVLFGLLGNHLTLWGAVCVNALVAVVARAIGRGAPAVAVNAEPRAPVASESAAPVGESRLVYAAAALVGFAFLALELVWYRMLAPLLGGTSLTFGLILACALAGIGIGGYAFSRRTETRPASLQLLSVTLVLEAVCVLVPFAWGDDLALVAAHLRPMGNLGFAYLLAGWTFVVAAVVLPASIVSGYQFPALFSLLGRGRAGVAEQVGRAYAFNTIGTLMGSLLAGFVLLPSLGSVALWRLLPLALAAFGLLCTGFGLRRGDKLKQALSPALLAVVAIWLSTARGPGNVFRSTPIGAGRVILANSSINDISALRRARDATVIWQRDGVESSVAIAQEDGLAFLVNGKSDGSVVSDRGTQAFLGLLPAALHGHVKSAFVVGLGTGMTSGLLGRVPGVERVDVAELEPTVLEVARRAALANGDVLNNHRVHIHAGDGRELLLTSSRSYDLVVSEPSNPFRAGVASLFTREYYQAAASRLTRHGLFAQWMQGYEVDAYALSMTIRTLREVFPHVSLWIPEGSDLILVASFEPQSIDAERLRHELAQPAYASWMRRAWGMEGVEGLLAHHVAPPRVLDALQKSVPASVNTDDVNELEFIFSQRVGDHRYVVTDDLSQTLSEEDNRPRVDGAVDWEQVKQLRHRAGRLASRQSPPSLKTQAVLAGCHGDLQNAERLWPAQAEPNDLIEVWVRGLLLASQNSELALPLAERLRSEGFVAESLLVRESLAEQRQDYDGAVSLLLQSWDEERKTALPLCDAVERSLKRALPLAERLPARAGELLRGLAQGPFAIGRNETARRDIQHRLGGRLADTKSCLQGLGEQRRYPVWRMKPLLSRALCLQRAAAPDAAAAEADLQEFAAHEPETFHQARSSTPSSDD